MLRWIFLFQIVLICFGQIAVAQTEPVKLAWVQIPNAVAYEIEVASLGTTGRPLVTRTVTIPEILVDLPPGSFNYRVRLVTASGSKGVWSDPQNFNVKAAPIALLTPATDTKSELGSHVRFSWEGASGYRYRIQVTDAKGAITERETNDTFFEWTAPSAGLFRWRVGYTSVKQDTWSDSRTVRVPGTPPPLRAEQQPKTVWDKTLWAGLGVTSYSGDFADTGNKVQASTLSGTYSFNLERHHSRFSDFAESKTEISLGVKQQSLVKKTVWLPDLSLAYAYLWPIRRFKIGPAVEVNYGKTGFFVADAYKNYQFDSFWRTAYAIGPRAEFMLGKIILSPIVAVGSASGGNPGLASGGVKPSTTLEAGLGAKLRGLPKWSLRLGYSKEDVKWTSSTGSNSLASNNLTLDLGGEL